MPLKPSLSNASHLIGHDARFAEAINQIWSELDFRSGAEVAPRRDAVVAAAKDAYGTTPDYFAVREAWDTVFPSGVYNAEAMAKALARAGVGKG